jgi:RNA polymerase sigma-70 factor (ECF subfamily)
MSKAEQALIDNLKVFVAFAQKRVGDPHLAADLVQDSLLKALKAGTMPTGAEDSVIWFYRILRRSIIDLYRRSDVRKRALERLEGELPEVPDAAAERTLCQCFKRLLPDMPATYREALQRVDLDGVPPVDAAKSLGISLNSFNVRLHRARRRLHEKLVATCRTCSKHGCLDCTCGSC